MTDEEINMAIAEVCGWECLAPDVWHNGIVGYSKDTHEIVRSRIPNYCSDLNAMHEVENVLSNDDMFVMAQHIERLVSLNNQHYFRATARQRAEAFLRTLGKWKEVAK